MRTTPFALLLLAIAACDRLPVDPVRAAPAPTESTPRDVRAAATTYSRVTAGLDHSCVLDASGRAFCMGYGGRGAIGYGGEAVFVTTPFAVTGGNTFTTIAAGSLHTCAITTGGVALCWGSNENGELGTLTPSSSCVLGTIPCSRDPVVVGGSKSFTTIDAGNQFTCALDPAGAAWCWGDNTFAQLGDGSLTSRVVPRAVAGGLAFVALRTGGFHACGLTAAGEIYCWGENQVGQLGAASSDTCTYFQPYPCSMVPIQVGGTLRFTALDAGSLHTCALDTSGQAWCWGRNGHRQLGDGGTNDQPRPVRVATTKTFMTIGVGSEESCAIDAQGQGTCWGGRTFAPPTVIAGFTWQALKPDDDHKCGIAGDGTAYCWGLEQYGEIGNGGHHQELFGSPIPIASPHLTDTPPVATFWVVGCVNLACTFNATLSTDDFGVVRYDWSFSDGTTDTGSIVNHTFPANGSYTVTLTVTDSASQSSSTTQGVDVFYLPPTASFTHSCDQTTGKCSFDGSASTDDGSITAYNWTPSDPARVPKVGVRISRAIGPTLARSWRERLIVTDDQSLTDTLEKVVVAPIGTNLPPRATIVSPLSGAVFTTTQAIAFAGSGTDPELGAINGAALSWVSSRDGVIGSGPTFTRTLSAGTHTITLKATDVVGAIGSTSVTITVNPATNQPPVARFTYSCRRSDFSCTFDASASSDPDGTIVSYSWHSDNPAQPKDKTGMTMRRFFGPSLTTWTETLTVTDDRGAKATKSVVVMTP